MKRYKFVFTEKQLDYIVNALLWGYEEKARLNKREYEADYGAGKWGECEEQDKAEGVYGMALRKKIMEKVGWKD